ncbi:uncharacterized protein LOC133310003 [Gastrolobium bilobum]|uniref:uncharacterized protein LOC133310003 n=1 Tax=Gastrolobium bilobum TaxID=150636 RepID=UPI002AB1DE15|nr:uncharacterized protein LOC133310003 [Gastrolobium bilobum]
MDPDWAYLPALHLSLILDKLVERLDHIWFSAVCKNWHSIAKLNHQNNEFKSKVLPMLMIPTERKSRKKRSLYGIAAKKVYHFQLPVPYSKRCCGSSHGWLATVDSCYVITLMNPFKNVAPIPLPPLNPGLSHKYLFEQNMHKVTLSVDPTSNPDDYVVAAVYTQACNLAFIKAGQKFWTYIDEDFLCFTDITFYKGAYLVKSLEGNLLMVRRFLGYHHPDSSSYSTGTESFEVYKLELDVQSGKLLQMSKLNSLGDNVLFLGDSDSISVSASYFSHCLRKDSIYYSDDFYDNDPYPFGPFDNGIYNVKDRSFAKYYPYNPSFKRMPPPLWVLQPFKWD